MALNTDSNSSFNKSRQSSSIKERAQDFAVKKSAEVSPVDKKGVLILSKFLHSLFVKYLCSGRIRAPQSSDLYELIQTFKSGAKHDRRALQSKFKSWSKRMVLREPDKALMLASNGKLIIPLEECDSLVLSIHLSRVKFHLTANEVAAEVKKRYTWTRKDFGMDWDIVVDAIKRGCKNTTCQVMCEQFYKAAIANVLSESHHIIPDCSPEGNFSKEGNYTAGLLMVRNNPEITCNVSNIPVAERSGAESAVSSSESSTEKNETPRASHSVPPSGLQIIPIPAVSAVTTTTAPSPQSFKTDKLNIQSSQLRFYIPCKPTSTVTSHPSTVTSHPSTVTNSQLLLSNAYPQIFPRAKPIVSEKPFQLVNKLEMNKTADITIRPLKPQVSALNEGKSLLWKAFVEQNLRTYSKKNVVPTQNKELVSSPIEENALLKPNEIDDSNQKAMEYEAQRLLMISKQRQSQVEESSHLGIKIAPLQCATVRKMKSQGVQTSPPKKVAARRKVLAQQPMNEGKKKFKDEDSASKEGGSTKAMYFIISRKKSLFQKKRESSYFQALNVNSVAPEKSSVTVTPPSNSSAKENEVTATHHHALDSNSNRKKQPRKSTPRKSVIMAKDHKVSSDSDNKEMMLPLRKNGKDAGNFGIPGSGTTRDIKKDSNQKSVESDVRKFPQTVDEKHSPGLPERDEPMDITMEKIVEHTVAMKSSFRQVLASEGRGKSIDVLKSKIIACERLVKKLKANPAIVNSSNEGNCSFLPSSDDSIWSSFVKMASKEA